jgi:hypothetical protein
MDVLVAFSGAVNDGGNPLPLPLLTGGFLEQTIAK